MFDKDAIQELSKAQAIGAAAEAITAQAETLVALPNDFTVHDFEKFMGTRRRARGVMATSNINDFAKYVADHKEAGAVVFIQQDSMTATAVLNLGNPASPGHSDNLAKLAPKKTAAYAAVKGIANGISRKQQDIAEFLEDWPGQVQCFNDSGKISPPQAIAAVRKITIESLRKLENTESQLSASRSAFESVQATSTEPLPTTIYFKTIPFHGLVERDFVLRLGVMTAGDKPAITLRIVNQEQHDEDMAIELAKLVNEAVTELPVLIGDYAAKT